MNGKASRDRNGTEDGMRLVERNGAAERQRYKHGTFQKGGREHKIECVNDRNGEHCCGWNGTEPGNT